MAFVVTARKWRPQRFEEVVGQEHITATLKNAIKNNRIAHAYLFTGPRGVGKTTTARILAKTLNCLNPVDNEPCNECEMCKSIQSTQSLDIIEIDGASNRGIDEIRTLRDSVKYAPTKGKFKIYIIDEVHMLTKESFNAFLKTLEEPPAHTIFIFATTDVHKVPLTIISRCQRFDFRRIQLDTIKTLLSKIAENENIEIDDKTLTIIAKKADGALRDAESFFDQIVSFCGNKIDAETVSKMLNLVDDEIFFTISDAVLDKNFKAVFDVTNSIYENGWNFIDFMDGLIEHFRNIMTVILTGKTELVETADVYRERYLGYINKFSEGDILRLLNFLNKTHQELRFAQNHKLKIEIALSHLIGLEKSATISSIIENLDNLPQTQNPSSNSGNNNPQPTNYKPQAEQKKNVSESVNKSYAQPAEKVSTYSSPKTKPQPLTDNSNNHFDFNSVANKWESFVEAVRKEKGLILGPFISRVKLIGIEGNNLLIDVGDDDNHWNDVVEQQEDYFAKKTHEVFGKKLNFVIKANPSNENSHVASNSISISSDNSTQIKKARPKKDDPYVDAIVNELGGEEIL